MTNSPGPAGAAHAFCTYFDSGYLSRGLAMYRSLRAWRPGTVLWVLCFDGAAYDALVRLALPGLLPIRLEDFEHGDQALLAAKRTRSRVEYYFTTTPSLPLYVLAQDPAIEWITYLDADLYFFGDPAPLFAELDGRSIGITAHRFPPRLRYLEQTGIYNVAWLSFHRDAAGLNALHWWRERCLEWCYDRIEPTRFADQKYLDDWPTRFPGVVVLQHVGANLAPWNFAEHRLSSAEGRVLADGQPLIFFHFHGLKQPAPWLFDANVSNYRVHLASELRHLVYRPYIRALETARRSLSITARPASARTADLTGQHLELAAAGSLPRLDAMSAAARRALHPLRALWARQYLAVIGKRVL